MPDEIKDTASDDAASSPALQDGAAAGQDDAASDQAASSETAAGVTQTDGAAATDDASGQEDVDWKNRAESYEKVNKAQEKSMERRSAAFNRLMSQNQRIEQGLKSFVDREQSRIERIEKDPDVRAMLAADDNQWNDHQAAKQELQEAKQRLAEIEAEKTIWWGMAAEEIDEYRKEIGMDDKQYTQFLRDNGLVLDSNGNVLQKAFANSPTPQQAVKAALDQLTGQYLKTLLPKIRNQARKEEAERIDKIQSRSVPTGGKAPATPVAQAPKGGVEEVLAAMESVKD